MQGARAKLKAVKRRGKDGSFRWFARGFVPIRQPDGSFSRRRVEHRIGGNTQAARQEEVDRLNRDYEDRARNIPLTFARAYLNYIEAGHPVPMHAERILLALGERQCLEIDDAAMIEARKSIFKPEAAPGYINRHLYTPVCAILHQALKERAPQLTRPRGHSDSKPIEIPDTGWYRAVLPHMGPDTRALVMFLTIHGRRLGDALGRRPCDFDPEAMTLAIGKTKTGDPMLVDLHPGVCEALYSMPGWRDRRWLFRDGPASASNVRKDIARACDAAGVRYYGPHAFGRHAFATRMLREGYSMQYVKDAGGWATIDMVAKRYGHLEKREVTEAVHKVADAFLSNGGKVGAGQRKRLAENGGKSG